MIEKKVSTPVYSIRKFFPISMDPLSQLPFNIPYFQHGVANLMDEAVTACNIVRQLDHPAHALFLLRPVDARIPDSEKAWSVSCRCTGHLTSFVSNDILILVMKVFLPTASATVYEPWLDRYVITYEKRTLRGWDAFAGEVISNYLFTVNWWSRLKEPVGWMGTAVWKRAEEEMAVLADALESAEKELMMDAKRIKREETQKRRPDEPHTKRQKLEAPRPLKLTQNELEVASCNADRQAKEHRQLLETLSEIFKEISADTFDKKLHRIAACVVCLGKQYPKIQWNFQHALNCLASDITDMSPWHVQRELAKQATAVVYEPLEALKSLV